MDLRKNITKSKIDSERFLQTNLININQDLIIQWNKDQQQKKYLGKLKNDSIEIKEDIKQIYILAKIMRIENI